jgi:hypothetical protein
MQSPLEIQPETAETLAAQAQEHGLSIDEYLKSLLGLPNGKEHWPAMAEFTSAMESLAEQDVKPLPRDFSRDDIYFTGR